MGKVQDKARALGERAIDVLSEIMDDWSEEAQHRIRAAESILDRGYGKAAQAVIAIPMERQRQAALAQMSDDELTQVINAEYTVIEEDGVPALPAPKKDPLLE
jgi:hypothetical protein